MAPTPPALLRSSAALDQVMTGQDRTNASLARLVGCKRQTIQKLRSGKATGCRVELADKIEAALGMKQGELFEHSVTARRVVCSRHDAGRSPHAARANCLNPMPVSTESEAVR